MHASDASVSSQDKDIVLAVNTLTRDGTTERHIKIRAGPNQQLTVACLTEYYEHADITVQPPVPISNWRDYIETQSALDPNAEFTTSVSATIREHVCLGNELLNPSPAALAGILHSLLKTPLRLS